MGKILSGYLFPHPPIIIKEIGRGEENLAINTIEGCKELARDIKEKMPDTIIVITPHGPLFRDAISISIGKDLEGDFRNFGRRDLIFRYENNLKLVNRIIEESHKQGIPVAQIDESLARRYNIDTKLDHGTLVPLYFVNSEYNTFKLVHITYGLLPPHDLFKFGGIIQKAVLESEDNAILLASGDLSHKLSDKGPYSYSPYGKIYDEKLVGLLKEGDFKGIVSFDLGLSERAGQCALRSLMILAGFLNGYGIKPEVLSYEGPFGVGYCNARFEVLDKDDNKNIYEDLLKIEKEKMDNIRKNENEYVRLARLSLEHYIKYNKEMETPQNLSKELLNTRHGAFVSIKKDGLLRGCIGTIEPTQENLAKEIIKNAINAGVRDPRFEPITEDELPKLVYSVDVLKEPEPISSMDELDPKKYGVIVSKGFRKGLLLPNLEGIDTPEEQVEIALGKAGIKKYEKYRLERFEVIRHY